MSGQVDPPTGESSLEDLAPCPRCGNRNPRGSAFCGRCGNPLALAVERRRLATLLFCDLVGSTAIADRLDPEAVRWLNLAYFAAARGAVERHGGTVEKFIGDAVMAIFGADEVHEDDAARAVRAALEIRESVRALSSRAQSSHGVTLQTRIGLNTGEVVTGDVSLHQAMVSGDAVNVAARLEQAAPENGILLGPLTRQLTRGEVATRSLGELSLKGKPLGVEAWEVVGPHPAGQPASQGGPFLGRDAELATIRTAFEACLVGRRPKIFTVLGEPGIGKSHLASAAVAELQCATAYARCPPYGEGMTYAPLRDMVQALVSARTADAPSMGRRVEDALRGSAQRERAAGVLSSLFATADGEARVEEVGWAVGMLLAAAARRRSLIIVLDDLQWAGPALADMVVSWSEGLDAPMLILGLARPELVELRPRWPIDLRLRPLSIEDSARLARSAAGDNVDPKVLERLVSTGAGNPLYLRELAAVVHDAGPDAVSETQAIPASLTAVLTARLDRLPETSRSVIDVASVQGEYFATAWVADALRLERSDLAARLTELRDRDLIRPDPGNAGSDARQAFAHILLRDVAYAALPLRRRAELHRALAAWTGAMNAPDADEMIGYHREQAFLAGSAVYGIDEEVLADAAASSHALASAGRRALERSDFSAAASLLGRALSMGERGRLDSLVLREDLGRAQFEAGDAERAAETFDELVRLARLAANDRMRVHGLLDWSDVMFYLRPDDPSMSGDAIEALAADGLAVFAAQGDHLGVAKSWMALANLDWRASCFQRCAVRSARALRHARRAGDQPSQTRIMATLAMAVVGGPTPLPRAVLEVDRLLERTRDDRGARAHLLAFRADARSMAGETDLARADHQAAMQELTRLGARFKQAEISPIAAEIELRAGNAVRAASIMEAACRKLREVGAENMLSTYAGDLAAMLCLAGRGGDAVAWAREARMLSDAADADAQIHWRVAEAYIAIHRGDAEAARSMAEQAHRRAAKTDVHYLRWDVAAISARAAAAAGKEAAARRFLDEARGLAVRKGAGADVARTDALAADLNLGGPPTDGR